MMYSIRMDIETKEPTARTPNHRPFDFARLMSIVRGMVEYAEGDDVRVVFRRVEIEEDS